MILFSEVLQAEDGQAFIVLLQDKKVKVISPQKRINNLSLIVKNKTLLMVRGKISYESGLSDQFLNIPSLKSRSIALRIGKEGRVYFIPLSPPFQKIELKFGTKTYEIPPK